MMVDIDYIVTRDICQDCVRAHAAHDMLQLHCTLSLMPQLSSVAYLIETQESYFNMVTAQLYAVFEGLRFLSLILIQSINSMFTPILSGRLHCKEIPITSLRVSEQEQIIGAAIDVFLLDLCRHQQCWSGIVQ